MASESATTKTSLRGIGIQEKGTFDGVGGVSFAGGAALLVAGDDLNKDPISNTIAMSTDSLTDNTLYMPI